MNPLNSELKRLARDGERRYEAAAEAPPTYVDDFVGGVSRARRRRQSGVAAAAVVALGLIASVGLFTRPDAVPATPPGHVVWTAEVGAEAWAAPAVAGGLVVAAGTDGVVHAFDESTGEPRWTADVRGAVRGGVAAADGDFFVVTDAGSLVRLDASGAEVWRVSSGTAVLERDVYDQTAPTPLVVSDTLGDAVVVGGRDRMVRAFDLATGEERWNVFAGAEVVASATAWGDVIFVGDRAGIMHALALADGAELWTADLGYEIVTSPAVVGDVLVTGTRGTEILGLEAATGERRWAVSLGSSWAESSVDTDGVTAYAGSSSLGDVLAIDGATGTVQWRAHVGGWPWARPTVADGQVFAATAWTERAATPPASLQALSAVTGELAWTAMTGGPSSWMPDGVASGIMASPSVGEGLVVVVALDGTVTAYSR